jgi:nicotinamidase-related amidase
MPSIGSCVTKLEASVSKTSQKDQGKQDDRRDRPVQDEATRTSRKAARTARATNRSSAARTWPNGCGKQRRRRGFIGSAAPSVMASKLLPYGPLGARTAHLCIDMQNLFAEETPWHTPWMDRVLPAVLQIARGHAAATILTRFVPPRAPDEMAGSWRRYYERWRELTLEYIDVRLLELVPPLAALAPPALILDKRSYSPFSSPEFRRALIDRQIDSIVITGAETDVCVLAAVLGAVDCGYRVVIASDAICSGNDLTHDALMQLYCRRFSEQIELADTDTILSCWLG